MKKIVFAMLGLAMLPTPPAYAFSGCLQVGLIWSWKPLDKKTLIVEDQLHEKFRLGLMGYCPALPYKLTLGFKALGATTGLDCVSRGDEVISYDVGRPYTCPVMSIAPYTPEMEKTDQPAAAHQGTAANSP